jgi:nitrous oxidase accessory protein NosD
MAATLRVANTGFDAPTCGPVAACRSIARAIANAAPGDTISVGPGLYSDVLDNDGVSNGPGEEPIGGTYITKPLQVVSELGASSTLVHANGPVFVITSGDVTLGQLGIGFTILTAGNAVLVGVNSELVNVRVGGNVIAIHSNATGPAAVIAGNTRGRFEHNRVLAPTGCFAGFLLISSNDLITRNVVMGCTDGFDVQGGARGARLVRNTAIGNSGDGFQLGGTINRFTGNVAIDNETGVRVSGPLGEFSSNTFAGNRSNCGVRNFGAATLAALGNYWGAPTGPGGDPADTVCDGSALTSPFLTSDPTRPQAALR